MGKRSRRERRQAQTARAVEARDPAALRALAERNPSLAAQAIGAAFASAREDDDITALVETAVLLASRLRRSGDAAALGVARRLAAAGASRSRALRLELALSAFAMGDDSEAARLVTEDPVGMAALAPLVAAARGGALPPLGDDASPGLRGLHAAGSAVASLARGEPEVAKATLRAIAPRARPAVLAKELGALADLSLQPSPRTVRALVKTLVESAAVRGSTEAARHVLDELAAAAPESAPGAAVRLGVSPQVAAAVSAASAAAASNGAASAMELAGRFGAAAFDAESRGTALLYEGFAALEKDPRCARRAFDQAVAQGADLIESLRGRLLLAMSAGRAACADCAEMHGTAGREAAAAADRLAGALQHVPGGAALASEAAKLAAEGWMSAGDTKSALGSIARARATARSDDNLDLLEAHALSTKEPQRAQALLEELLTRNPGHRDAWLESIRIAEVAGNRVEAEERVLAAAAATGDARLCLEARRVRVARGELAAFADMVAGRTSPGALAVELERHWQTNPGAPLPAQAEACRSALDEAARLAFDAATWVIASSAEPEAARSWFEDLAGRWAAAPEQLAKLAAVAMWLHPDAVVSAATSLSSGRRTEMEAALVALAEAALAAEVPAIAGKILAIGARHWRRTELRRLETQLRIVQAGSAPTRLSAADPDVVVRELDRLLAPELSIRVRIEEAEKADDLDGGAGSMGLGALRMLLTMEGRPAHELDRLPEAVREQLGEEFLRILARGDAPDAPKKYTDIMRRLIDAIDRADAPARAARPPSQSTARNA